MRMIFANPAFLWGLLAVLIPIAVHLFNFHRYRTVYFSNVDRLAELHTESRRSSNLRRWLLLALRILAVVFLVLAFAQPVIPDRANSTRSGATVVSVYVDNTHSMESASTEGSLLDEAVRKAREIAGAHAIGDRYQLVTADLGGKSMRWLSRDEFLEALDEVRPSAASPRMSDVVRRQLDFMRQSGAPNRHAYVVSDFQRSASDLDAMPADSLASVTLVPLQGTGADNLFIDTVRLNAPAYFAGGSVDVDVTVRNSGSRDAEKVPLKLLVGGHERAMATVDIPAGATAKATLRFAIDATGWVDGSVSIEDYPVIFDDNYFFTFRVADRIAVLDLHGGTANPHLQRLFADDSTMDYNTATRLPADLAGFDFIVLDEVGEMPSGEVQMLAAWVADGGTLLVVPSPRGADNTLLATLKVPQLARWHAATLKASRVDFASSLFSGVFSAKSDEMEMPTVHGHFPTLNAQASAPVSIITLADGSDLLSATTCGDGRVYLFSTPLRNDYTDFTSQALFVPTLYNMALFSRPLPPPCHTLGDPAPIVLQGRYDSGNPPHLASTGNGQPAFSVIPDLRRTGNRTLLVPHGEIGTDGIYIIADEHLAFNHPRRESQMDFLSSSEVADAVGSVSGYSVIANTSRHLGDELRARDGGRRLWLLCLILALAALAAETAVLKLNTKH